MLQKNGEREAKDLKKKYSHLFDLIGKNKTQVTFRLVPSLYNGKKKKPRSVRFPTEYVAINTDTGETNEYLYYESVANRNIGGVIQPQYSPSFMAIQQRGEITLNLGHNVTENLDKFVWFMNHNRRANSKDGDTSRNSLFYLEDKAAEAAEKVQMKQSNAAMQKFLYDEDARMPEEDLRTIAKALRVGDVENMTFPEVQTSIEFKCKKNPNLFLAFKGVGKEVEMRANLQTAVERGIISYFPIKEKWFLNDKDSGTTGPLAPVRKTENEMDALIYWIKNKDISDNYGKIMELLTGVPSKEVKQNTSENSELEMKLKLMEAENKKLALEAEKAKAEKETAEANLALSNTETAVASPPKKEAAKKK